MAIFELFEQLEQIKSSLENALNSIQENKDKNPGSSVDNSLINETSHLATISDNLQSIFEQTNQQITALIEKTGQIIYTYNSKNDKINWYGAIEEITGHTSSEFSKIGIDAYIKLIHPDDKHAFILQHSEARKQLINYTLEYRLRCKNGRHIYVLDKGQYSSGNGSILMLGAIADISGAKKAEELIHAKERSSQLSRDISIIATNVETVDELIRQAMKVISYHTHWNLAHSIILYNIKYNLGITHSICYSPFPERYSRIIGILESASAVNLSKSHIKVLMEKKAIWIKNLGFDGEHHLSNEAKEAGLRNLIIFPLMLSGQVIGMLEFFAEHSEISDSHMPGLMEQIGLQLGTILEQKAYEVELKKLSMAIEQNFASVVITNAEGFIEYVNPKFTEISGYKSEEVLGKKPSIVKSDVHDDLFYSKMWNQIKSGEKWQGEICNRHKNGVLYWEQVNISPIKNAKSEISHFVAVKIDITEKRKAEEELHLAKEAAEAANKAKSEFLANMSHEIRTPMNAILGFAEVMAARATDEQQISYLDSIRSSGKNLLTIINDVLDLSKVEAGKLKISKEYIDPFLLFKDIEYMFSLKAREKGLEFKIDTDFNLPIGIETDEVRLRQILINLIGNAIKFTEKGSVLVHVTCKKLSDNEVDIVVDITDTGIGISNEFQKVIFKPFTQEDSQTTKRFGGTGLGLTITKRLVELLNGELKLESKQGKGCKFTVLFKKVRSTYKKQMSTDLLTIDPHKILFKPAVILVADDVENNRKYFKSVLQDTGLTILECSNGLETYEMAKLYRPDVIITDLKMPGCNGFELLNKIRADELLKKTTVVATTATASIEERDKLNVHNFDGILIKPIQVNDVYMELMRVLPHDILQESIEDGNDGEMSIMALPDSDSKLVKLILEHELYDIWKSFTEQQPLDEVEEFAFKVRDLGKKYNLEILLSYGNRLITSVNNFDIDTMSKTLSEYPKLLNTFILVN
jgi:PAS domain S-box-containing protein